MIEEVEEIYNNYMKAWDCLLKDNIKIVEEHGYSHEDAKELATIITVKILEKW